MIHVLVVSAEQDIAAPDVGRSAIEVLHARGADEAVEKLARNRRIDAVLLIAGADNAAVARAIREELLPPPPLFAPPGNDDLPGVRRLPGQSRERLLDEIAAALLASG